MDCNKVVKYYLAGRIQDPIQSGLLALPLSFHTTLYKIALKGYFAVVTSSDKSVR